MLGGVRRRLAAGIAALLLAPFAAAGERLEGSGWWRTELGAAALDPPGPGIPVTVVDTGVDLAHPEFAGRPDTVALNAQSVVGGREFHGTAVASIVSGFYGQARLYTWDASPAGFLTNAAIISGLEAAPAPGVTNLSLGGRSWNRAEADAIARLFGRGNVVVAAVGNDGDRGSPSSFPADLQHVLTVGSIGATGKPSSFTTRSRAIDVAAPGEGLLVAVPPNTYAPGRGTSMAAPFVSAAVAWIWTLRPELDHTQVVELVRRTARDVDPPGRDEQTGFGVVDVAAALVGPAPIPDPLEPNDDVNQAVSPAPESLSARLDISEDVEDVYRVVVPPQASFAVELRSQSGVHLDVWDATTPTVRARGGVRAAHLLASGRRTGWSRQDAAIVNRTSEPLTAYVHLRLAAGVADASYALWFTAGARP